LKHERRKAPLDETLESRYRGGALWNTTELLILTSFHFVLLAWFDDCAIVFILETLSASLSRKKYEKRARYHPFHIERGEAVESTAWFRMKLFRK